MKTIYTKLLILVLLLPLSAFAQGTLNGKVTDQSSGQPLPGVSVIIQGTQNGTSTDMDGNFSLSNVKRGDKVVFTFIGYKEVVQNYDGQKSVSVVMEEQSNELQEVVVQVGYGSVKKKDATGSLTTVSSRDFNKGTNVTAENLLNGRVAGLTINTSGAAGSGSQIRIRGGSSLNASNDPLIVIDGLPISNSTVGGSTSILASINPSDIDSFTILKDASATAIYGSRASNGVIIITTKKGGKSLAVDYNFQYGSGRAVNKVDVLSAAEFRKAITDNRPADVPLLGTANTDWQDEIYRNTDFVDHNITVKGSLFKKIPTRLSIGNTYQEGLRLTNDFNRTTASVSMNPSLFNDHLKINLNANYAREKNRFADGVEGNAIYFDPTQPVYDAASPFDGFFEYTKDGFNDRPDDKSSRNPVALLLQRSNVSKVNRFYGNVEFDYKFHFLPELRAVLNLGFDQAAGEGRNSLPSSSAAGNVYFDATAGHDVSHGSYSEYTSDRKNKLLDAYLVYRKDYTNMNFDVTGGYSYQKFESEDYNSSDLRDNNTQTNSEVTTNPDIVLIGFFARSNISFNNKYLFTLSYRRDGSSRFGDDYKWGNFPGAAFAWKIKEESFLRDSKVFSDLKLRLGYGVTGQQDIAAAYSYLDIYRLSQPTSQYTFGTTPTIIGMAQFKNSIIKWEETTTYNAGLDYGFANNRIRGAVDVFYKESKDLLSYVRVPDGTNLGNAGFQNIGDFTTKGIEFSISTDIVKTDNTLWNVNFNATHYERKITRLLGGENIQIGGISGGTGNTVQIYSEGFNPSSFYVYKQLYDADNNPIQGAVADINGDNIINDNDRYIYKNADPKVIFGFASAFNYKNLDFSFNLRANIGGRIFNNINSNNAQFQRLRGDSASALTNIPSSTYDSNFVLEDKQTTLLSDYYIENASFLKMDNVTLGYTFPKWLDGKASLRIYSGVQNVFTLTKYSGLDPEITGGIDNTIYPRPRTILVGANVKF
ncbi:SusC/RagA family TonB-linked outer membrane protein [Flavobacterium pallidum]|uniref:SusC/RagA family TonB-linked outer membrane protein n=1 Tax=Flavobacterium pallidum TaxID=2172098 RepID=A0A2S1SGA6_9FLAO|nr:SusC/RagA family TonB-linked outer membrane protein [Flavobacterium pallidum]AWI25444.1 SusC/RagA family TonB-linked outer membrane protein [Flavobacterium pallidum]